MVGVTKARGRWKCMEKSLVLLKDGTRFLAIGRQLKITAIYHLGHLIVEGDL